METQNLAPNVGTHHYPGCADEKDFFTSDCEFGCGCWMGGSRSGGPDGVDPFGLCPNNPGATPAPEPPSSNTTLQPPAESLPTVIPPPKQTLYAVEEQLAALIDTEDLVSEDQRMEYLQDLATASAAAIRKRDGVNYFLVNCEAAIEAATREIDRLKERRDMFRRVVDSVEAYVLRIIRKQGQDAKGKYPPLKGDTVTFSAAKNRPSIEVYDEAAVPSQHKRLLIQIPAVKWEEILDSVSMELRAELLEVVKAQGCDISKTGIKEAIDAGGEVPGAHVAETSWRLSRK